MGCPNRSDSSGVNCFEMSFVSVVKNQIKMCKICMLSFHALPQKYSLFGPKIAVFQRIVKNGLLKIALAAAKGWIKYVSNIILSFDAMQEK
jgi:hypothetical protein